MATPASLTYAQLETRVMNQLRMPTSNATEQAKIAAMINEVYRDLYSMADWWWLVKRSVINTVVPQETGTVSVTNSSTSITFSSGPTPSVAGYTFHVPGNTNDSLATYRVSTHTAGATAATLDAAYTGDDDTAASFTCWDDSYSLPADTGKLLKVRRAGFPWPVDLISPTEMQSIKEVDTSEGTPRVATVWDFSTTGDPTTARQLVVHPYPDATYRLEVHYKQQLNTELSSSTQPLIPDEYRQILVYGSLARGYPIFLNDTERGLYFTQLFDQLLARMIMIQKERGEEVPQIMPRDEYRRFYQSGRRRGRVSLGSYFDRFPNIP